MPREYPDRPIVGVGVVVLHGDAVLLVRRKKPPRPGHWSLPGGAQKLGETVFEAARREVREETGLEIEVTGLVDVVDFLERDERGRMRYHYTLVDIAAESGPGEPTPQGDVDDARWVPLRDIGTLGLWNETVRVIREAAQRRGETDR